MKKLLTKILATTGLTLITLATIASLCGGKFLFISSVYQSLAVNVIIYLGLNIIQNIESEYFIIDVFRDVTFILFILTAGYLFDWYKSTPLWVVIIMSVIIYVISCFINIVKVTDDIAFINNQLEINKKKD
ncbi:MAG: hypothetical protein GX238_05910 [Epulopiscium sp.]|nr:hypothetical protein [Candidatus Epulonipiscium sp.]